MKVKTKKETVWVTVMRFGIDIETVSYTRRGAISKIMQTFRGKYSWDSLKRMGRKVVKVSIEYPVDFK